MSRPRVVHVYKDVWPPVQGGVERVIHELVRRTRGRFDPAVVVASQDRRGRRREIADGVPVIEIPSLGRALSTPLAPGFVRELRRIPADLFHFHFPHPTGEVAWLLARRRVPAVVTYHSDVVRQKTALRIYAPLMRRFLAGMDVIMPTSGRYLETSETLAPHRDRCRVVPLGIALEDYEPTPERERRAAGLRDAAAGGYGSFIFFLGVLRYYKGLEVLLAAMERLPEARLVIAGKGPMEDALRAMAAPLGERVRFVGAIGHEEAVAHLRAARVFCLPATHRSEAFGLCQIEAMACGTPVVSTDLPTGVPEVNRHEESGLIVPPGDPAALADALGRLLADDGLHARLAAGADERAASLYTSERMARDVMNVYDDVLRAGANQEARP